MRKYLIIEKNSLDEIMVYVSNKKYNTEEINLEDIDNECNVSMYTNNSIHFDLIKLLKDLENEKTA